METTRFAHFNDFAFMRFEVAGFVMINSTRAMRRNGLRPAAVAQLLHDAFHLDDPKLARPDLAASAFESYGHPTGGRLSTSAAAGRA